MTDKIMTIEFRVSFPHLFKAQKMNESSDPKYGLSMLFPKGADLSNMKKVANETAKEKWGDKMPNNIHSPFINQGDYEYEGYEAGAIFVRATSKHKPGVVDANVQPIIDESEIYPGCYARATVRPFAYDVNGNRGVSFGLQNIQKTRDGDPIGGRVNPEDEFSAVGDTEIASTSTDSLFD